MNPTIASAGVLAGIILTSTFVRASQEPVAPPQQEVEKQPTADYDTPPQPVRITKPVYPSEAFKKRVEGTVLLEILIDAEGHVARARVLQSVPELDEAALECVKEWQFNPARKEGKPVATLAQAPITFRVWIGPRETGVRVRAQESLWATDPEIQKLAREEIAKGHVRKGVVLPRKLKNAWPKYPKDAAQSGTTGVVVVTGRIDPTTGKPRDLQAIEGPSILADAALKAMKRWRYQPLVIDGVKYEVQLRVELTFSIE